MPRLKLLQSVIFGFVTDRSCSRQPLFLVGLLALAAATTMLYIGNSLVLLLLGRAAQGVATAVVHTVGISLIVDKSPPENLGSALGVIGTSIATAIVVGPILGGFLYRYAGYHAVFVLSYALLGLDVGLRLLMIEDGTRQRQAGTPDYSNDPPHTRQNRLLHRIPGTLWLLASPRILICLVACFLNATLLTSFDSVCTTI